MFGKLHVFMICYRGHLWHSRSHGEAVVYLNYLEWGLLTAKEAAVRLQNLLHFRLGFTQRGGGRLGVEGDVGVWGAHVGFACRDMCYDEKSLASPLFTLLLLLLLCMFCKYKISLFELW